MLPRNEEDPDPFHLDEYGTASAKHQQSGPSRAWSGQVPAINDAITGAHHEPH